MKVDDFKKREEQNVKAIVAYDKDNKIISSIEMDFYSKFHTVVGSGGSGKPRVYIDLKNNIKRGNEIDIVFLGKYNIEKLETKSNNWVSFGHIVMSINQAKDMANKILKICNKKQSLKLKRSYLMLTHDAPIFTNKNNTLHLSTSDVIDELGLEIVRDNMTIPIYFDLDDFKPKRSWD